MLARCEEVDPPQVLLDNHQRFPATASHAFRHGYLERLIVDEWLGILRQVIARLWPRLPLVQSQFQVLVSHDVDAPSAYAFGSNRRFLHSMASRILKQRDISGALKASYIRLLSTTEIHSLDPFNTFEWLMDLSDRVGICSAFYFMCGRTEPRLDAQYEPDHLIIRSLMRRINERGHELGLHPSYKTCNNSTALLSESRNLMRIVEEENINQRTWGGRMHYLRWSWPTTAYGWIMSGFDYDSTLSYADRPGFRCGTCHEYKMFDPLLQKQLNLIQRPLIVMETSVIAKRYLGLGYGQLALDKIRELKYQCQKVQGNFTLLWHNSSFVHPASRNIYEEVLFS